MSSQRAGSVYVPLGGKMKDGQIVGRTPSRKSSAPKFMESLSKVKRSENIGAKAEPKQEVSPELSLGQLFEDVRQANLADQGVQGFSSPQAPFAPPMLGAGIMMGPGQAARIDPSFMNQRRQVMSNNIRNRRRGMR